MRWCLGFVQSKDIYPYSYTKPAFLVFCGTLDFFLCDARRVSVIGRTSGSETPPMLYHEGLFCSPENLHVLPTASCTTSESAASIIQGFRIPGDMHYHMSLQWHMRN